MKVIAALFGVVAVLAILAFIAFDVFGYWTHIIFCFQHHEWLRLIAGCLLVPVGVIDGWGLTFHWWS